MGQSGAVLTVDKRQYLCNDRYIQVTVPMKVTIREYAEAKGLTKQTVWAKVKKGILKAEKQPHSGMWLIEIGEAIKGGTHAE